MGDFHGTELDELVLSSDRLTLRPWQRSDATAVHEALQDRSAHEFLRLPDPYTAADAVQFVTEYASAPRHAGTGVACALVESATERLVGSAVIRLPTPPRTTADVGYLVFAPARRQGYAAEACRALASWAFSHGVGRVQISCAVANLASAKSALNAGFRFEGILRGELETPAGPADGAVFGRVPGDPPEPVARRFAALPGDAISDGVLTLRVLLPTDVRAMLEQESDPGTVDAGFTGVAPSEADITRMVTRAGLDWLVGNAAPLAIVDVATDRVAGSLRLRHAGPPDIGGIGYAVHPDFRGRGYTTRALRLLVPWAFEVAGFARLELGAKVDNVASQRAALGAGFEPEGALRTRLRHPEGTFSDEVRFALVNPRYRSVG